MLPPSEFLADVCVVICPCCGRLLPLAGPPGDKAVCWFCGALLKTGVLVVRE